MLRKLMKYDLKYYRKIMLPLWAVLIIYGIVHGINTVFNYETFYDHIPIKAQAIVVVTGIYFIFCVNIILVIQRFWKSMYGKESYLTHTLPVTERKLILSKVFSAIIISFTTVFIFFAENDILIYIQSIVYHGEASLQGIPFIILENEKMKELSKNVEFGFWEKYDDNHTVVRFATSWSTDESSIDELEEYL